LPPLPPPACCLSYCAVVLPASPPLPVRCLPRRRRVVACCAALWCCPRRRCHRRLLCCRRAVAHRAALWCYLPCCCHHCLCAACHVAIRWLHVVLHCGAAHIPTACVLPVMLLSGGCMLCCTSVAAARLAEPSRSQAGLSHHTGLSEPSQHRLQLNSARLAAQSWVKS